MFSKAYSATIHGIDGLIVSVEADVSDGLPIFDMVGYLGSEVRRPGASENRSKEFWFPSTSEADYR